MSKFKPIDNVYLLATDDHKSVVVIDCRRQDSSNRNTTKTAELQFLSIAGGRWKLPVFQKTKIASLPKPNTPIAELFGKTEEVFFVPLYRRTADWGVFPRGVLSLFPRVAVSRRITFAANNRKRRDILPEGIKYVLRGYGGPFVVDLLCDEEGTQGVLIGVRESGGYDFYFSLLLIKRGFLEETGVCFMEVSGGPEMHHLSRGNFCVAA